MREKEITKTERWEYIYIYIYIYDVSVYDVPLILVIFLCKHDIQPYFMKEITRVGYDFQSMKYIVAVNCEYTWI